MVAFVSSTFLGSPKSFASIAACRPRTATPGRTSVRMVADPVLAAHQLLATNPAAIQAVADAFNTLKIPEPVTTYGHPVMMGFMVLGMGVPGAALGWLGRVNKDKKEGVKQKSLHENIMLAFWLLSFAGATGGILSTAMSGYDILESPHALSAGAVLAMLSVNAAYAYSGFGGGKPKDRMKGRTIHAYLGAATMGVFALHAATGASILLG